MSQTQTQPRLRHRCDCASCSGHPPTLPQVELDRRRRAFHAAMLTIKFSGLVLERMGFYRDPPNSALAVARSLVVDPFRPQEGFTNLWQAGQLDRTMEHMIWTEKQFHHPQLISAEDVERVRIRLREYGYFARVA